VHRNGSLIFRNVAKRHESSFRCPAQNSAGSDQSPYVRLNVEAEVQIVKSPDVIRKPYGSQVDLTCSATGDPPPLITWLKGGRPVSESSDEGEAWILA